VGNQKSSQQQWINSNPGYWKKYRKKNPEKAERNRITQAMRKGNEKGSVESAVGYVKKNFLAGLDIPDFNALKPAVIHWLNTVANVRLHGETGKMPVDRLGRERQSMTQLPPYPYDIATIDQVRASPQFRVAVDGNRYSVPKQPFYFYSDAYASQLGLPRANLTDEKWRSEMKQLLIQKNVKLWVVDNIASLAPGLDENQKKDWDPINQWLLELRFAGVSTLMLHHTNKEGGQRGTSAREDNLDISILLKSPNDYTTEDGARFVVHFTKQRVQNKYLKLLADTEFKLIQDESGHYVWSTSNVKGAHKREVLKMFDDGFDQKAIVEMTGLSKGYVSKIKNRAAKDGLLTKKGKLTQDGFSWLSNNEK